MAVRPIIFSAPMVKALLAGRKTQTRRVAKITAIMGNVAITSPDESLIELEPGEFKRGVFHYLSTGPLSGPYDARFAVGDVLYVREQARGQGWDPAGDWEYFSVQYAADNVTRIARVPNAGICKPYRYPEFTSGRFMPRWASRLTLAVTDVRVERLQDISEADAQAEGICRMDDGTWSWSEDTKVVGWHTPRGAFDALWTSINGPAAWAENPWIVALTFNVHRQNVDQYLAALASEARGVG